MGTKKKQPEKKRYRCPECNGTGEIQMESDEDGAAADIVECPVCNGTGDDQPTPTTERRTAGEKP